MSGLVGPHRATVEYGVRALVAGAIDLGKPELGAGALGITGNLGRRRAAIEGRGDGVRALVAVTVDLGVPVLGIIVRRLQAERCEACVRKKETPM